MGGLGARGDGRTGLAGVKQGAAAGLCNGGGVPVAWGGGRGVGELPGGELKRSVGLVVV